MIAPIAVLTSNSEAYLAFLRGREFMTQTSPSWPKGISAFQRAVELDPQFALAWANLGRLAAAHYANASRSESTTLSLGKHAIDEAIRLQPELPEAHLARAFFLRATSAPRDAVEREVAAAEKKRPNDPEILGLRAAIESSHGRHEVALKLWQQTVALDPRNGSYLNSLGNALRQSGRYADAEAMFRQAFQILGSSIPLTNRALTYFHWKGDRELVIRTLEEAPAEIRAEAYWAVRSSLLYFLGDCPSALAATTELNTRTGQGFRARLHLVGQIRDASGDKAGAQRDYLAALPEAEKQREEFSAVPRAHAIVALIYVGLGRKEEALAAARKSLECLRPDEYANEAANEFFGGYTALALVQARFGLTDEALAIVQAQVAAGWWRRNYLLLSPDWAILRKDPRFRAIAEKAPL